MTQLIPPPRTAPSDADMEFAAPPAHLSPADLAASYAAAHAVQSSEDPDAGTLADLEWVAALVAAASGDNASALVIRDCQLYRQGGYVKTEFTYRARVESPDGAVGHAVATDKAEAARLCILDWREKRVAMLADAAK